MVQPRLGCGSSGVGGDMGTSSWGFSLRLRDEQSRREFDKQQQSSLEVDEAVDYNIAKHKRELAEQRAKEEAQFVDQARRPQEKAAQEKRQLQDCLLNAMYQSNGATDIEIERVNRMIQTKCPES